MAKTKTAFFCQNCGAQHAKWVGQCTSCKQWNTLSEELLEKAAAPAWKSNEGSHQKTPKPLRLSEIDADKEMRLSTRDTELDQVLGGGLVPGSMTLIGGEPGIGKSTLLLQIALRLNVKTLYVSGEESQRQIKMRAERIAPESDSCYILTETNTSRIFRQINELNPDLVIVDSIQTLHSEFLEAGAGSVSQIRECTAELIKFAKESHTPVILIGHITKDGSIAGPKILEHMVDTVLQFEGDRNHVFRIVRALKNRFGSIAELGIYEMKANGLIPVANPSQILISQNSEDLSGTAIAATVEGVRPLLIEIQALVSTAVYGTPQRSATGFPAKRLNMLLAVLEKRAGFKLAAKDVFLNITGGIQVDDPAIDLGVLAAILSSNADIPIPRDICFAAEVGLAGEIRPVPRISQRITEAEKLGFSQIYISTNVKGLPKKTGIGIQKIAKVEDLVSALFG
ncbi:DNA repair protein RadA [Robiginitalea sp. IMCC44478]|uniref:DNA repair protein RadA n=1 Tax=Robiginitalea sp. IMCC44478 TaxID=3459122 RepID=UPI0040437DB1